MSEIDEFIKKIIDGVIEMSREDLQLYINNAEEVERRLRENYEYKNSSTYDVEVSNTIRTSR